MIQYVLTKGGGKYVNPPGCIKSYTSNKAAARRFDTKEAAEREACGNEWAVPL